MRKTITIFAAVREMLVSGCTGSVRILERRPGDGTVTRVSALGDEREGGAQSPELRSAVPWSRVTLLFTDHLVLTKDAAFTDNMLFLFLENRATRVTGFSSR
ncbi:MAG: hypothetical protein AABZ47_07285 [Planctomycetota bacterium]